MGQGETFPLRLSSVAKCSPLKRPKGLFSSEPTPDVARNQSQTPRGCSVLPEKMGLGSSILLGPTSYTFLPSPGPSTPPALECPSPHSLSAFLRPLTSAEIRWCGNLPLRDHHSVLGRRNKYALGHDCNLSGPAQATNGSLVQS